MLALPSGSRLLPIKIALVDDDLDDLYFMKRSIARVAAREEIQVETICFTNSRKAIEGLLDRLNTRQATHYVCLDINMPGWSGFDVLQLIRSDELLCELPVAVLTTASDTATHEKAYAMGADHVFVKPGDTVSLERIFSTLLLEE